MKIVEILKSKHEIICIHWNGADEETHEKWVDIHKDSEGELITVSVGSKEITSFELAVLDFLKRQGKL